MWRKLQSPSAPVSRSLHGSAPLAALQHKTRPAKAPARRGTQKNRTEEAREEELQQAVADQGMLLYYHIVSVFPRHIPSLVPVAIRPVEVGLEPWGARPALF